jgi:hypothetical protein
MVFSFGAREAGGAVRAVQILRVAGRDVFGALPSLISPMRAIPR